MDRLYWQLRPQEFGKIQWINFFLYLVSLPIFHFTFNHIYLFKRTSVIVAGGYGYKEKNIGRYY